MHIDTEKGWRGGEAQVFLLCEGIQKLNHNQIVVAQPDSPLAKKSREIGLDVLEIKMNGELDLRAARSLRKVIKAKGIDICHAHTSHAHTLALLSTYKMSKPLVVVSRRVDFKVGKNPFSKMKFRNTDHIIAISNGVKDVLVNSGINEEKISIVFSGIDIKKYDKEIEVGKIRREFGIPPGAILVGNVAQLVDHKGHKYLIDAAKTVLSKIPGIYFMIVGDGELEETLRKQITANNLENHVILAGYRDDVENFLKDFNMFVMSSHLEGLCTSILDALLMGLPVVATDTGGIPDIIIDGETGLLAVPRDSASLAECIIKMINNEELQKKFINNGKNRVKKCFSSDLMVKSIEQIYYELIGWKKTGW